MCDSFVVSHSTDLCCTTVHSIMLQIYLIQCILSSKRELIHLQKCFVFCLFFNQVQQNGITVSINMPDPKQHA